MTVTEEIVKMLRTGGAMDEFAISSGMLVGESAYMIVRGEKKMIPPDMVRQYCEQCHKIEGSGDVWSLKTEYE